MAQLLQRRYSLPVVRITVDAAEGEPRADLQLVVNADGNQEVQDQRSFDLGDFGCGGELTVSEPELRVPREVREWIVDWIRGLRASSDNVPPANAAPSQSGLGGHAALWLHFFTPHGSLGAVPWERDLQPDLGRPLLRLPDMLPDPDRSSSTFDVALVATVPAAEGPSTATQMGPGIARAITAGVGGRLRLHVFADAEAYDTLEAELADVPAREIHVHRAGRLRTEPRAPLSSIAPPHAAPAVENPWLLWIRQAMTGRTLDAVHFLVHGHSLGDDGAVLTSSSPTSPDRLLPRTLQTGELLAFLNQVGALNATFSRPADNYSDYGLRQVVSELSSLRSGPVMLHDPRVDPDLSDLQAGYQFLSAAGPARPPASASLTLCAQPHRVLRNHPEDIEPQPSGADLNSSAAVKDQFNRDETPMWLGAAERYIEHWEGDLIKFQHASKERTPTSMEVSYYAGVESALHKIRDVIDRHAEQLP